MSLIVIIVYMPVTVAQSEATHIDTFTSYPKILNFDFSPRELILDNASLQVALRIHVADEGRDIESIEIVFSSPCRNETAVAFMNTIDLLSGDACSGNYTSNLSFSPNSQAGIWTVKHLIACDKAGDCQKINAASAEMLGFPVDLQVLKKDQNADIISDIISQSDYPSNSSADQGIREAMYLGLDPNELRGWASTEKRFAAQRKIIINSVFNRPSICWP